MTEITQSPTVPAQASDPRQRHYSMDDVQRALDKWCDKHPAWVSIALLDEGESDSYYVQWHELTPTQQAHWQSEYGYDEFATKRCKVKTGQITGDGAFYENIAEIPMSLLGNSCMVFCVGRKRARELRARERQYWAAIQTWLGQNTDWILSRNISQAGRRLLSVQWDELTPELQAKWGTPERYEGSGTMRNKYPAGFVHPEGFAQAFKDLPLQAQRKYELVFKVGQDHSPFYA